MLILRIFTLFTVLFCSITVCKANAVPFMTDVNGYSAKKDSPAKTLIDFVKYIKVKDFKSAEKLCSKSYLKKITSLQKAVWAKQLIDSDFKKRAKFRIKEISPSEVEAYIDFHYIKKDMIVGLNLKLRRIDGVWLIN